MANLSGTWLGTYWQQTNPTRFEATFIQGGNTLSGNILDGNYLGEATLSGKVIGHKINFAKQYLIGSQYIINYVGTISEDENFIQGQWLINRFNSGIWEAHRSNENLILDLKNIVSEDLPLSLS